MIGKRGPERAAAHRPAPSQGVRRQVPRNLAIRLGTRRPSPTTAEPRNPSSLSRRAKTGRREVASAGFGLRDEVGGSLSADRMRPRAQTPVYGAEPPGGNARGDKAGDPGDDEGELGAALGAKPAGKESAERACAVEGIEVDADDPAA